jgi:hypothetical protein
MATLALGLRAETRVFRHLVEYGLNDWTRIDEELIDDFVMDICDAQKTKHLEVFLDKGGAASLSPRQLGGMLVEVIAASATQVNGRVPGLSLVKKILDKSPGDHKTAADPNFPCVLLLPDSELWMGSMEGNPWSHRSVLCDWSRETNCFLFPLHDVDGDYAVSLSPLSVAVFYGQLDIFDLLRARGAHMDTNKSPLDDSSHISQINLQVPAHQPLYVALDRIGSQTRPFDRIKWLCHLSKILKAGTDLNARALVRFGNGEKAFQMYVTPALLILTRLARTGHTRPPWHPRQRHRDVQLHEALLTTLLCRLSEEDVAPAPRATLLPSVELGGSTRVRSPFHLLMDGFRTPGTDTHSGSWEILLDKDEHPFNFSLFAACIKLGSLARNGGEVLARYYIQPTSQDVDKYRDSWRLLIDMVMMNRGQHENLGYFVYQYVKTVFGEYRGHEHGHGILDTQDKDEVASTFPAQYELISFVSLQRPGIINYRPIQDTKSALHHVVTIWPFVSMKGLERTLSMAKAAFIHWLITDLCADQHVLWQGVTPWEFVVQQTERAFADGRKDNMFDGKEEAEMRGYLARFLAKAFGESDWQWVEADAGKKQRRVSFGDREGGLRACFRNPKY